MSVEGNLKAVLDRGGKPLHRILQQLVPHAVESTMPVKKKYIRIAELADRAAKIVAPSAPCKKGCSSCCHIAVGISDMEADRISEFTGIKRKHVAPWHIQALLRGATSVEDIEKYQNDERMKYFRAPCTFLGKGGECTIYSVRPMACRTYFSLQDTEAECSTAKYDTTVQTMNLQEIDMAMVAISMEESYGDIRDYFPDTDEWLRSGDKI